MSFQMALFSFVGIEMIGVTAGETKDPQKLYLKQSTLYHYVFLVFYVGALAVIMSIIPWDKVSPDDSPFVRLFALIGIPFAAGLINFVVLTAAASSCNSGIFSNSRMLFDLPINNKHHLF